MPIKRQAICKSASFFSLSGRCRGDASGAVSQHSVALDPSKKICCRNKSPTQQQLVMRALLLLAAVLVATSAQTPPHILFTPQNYYIGTQATFSLTSYARESFPVTLTLVYETCTCNARQRRQQCTDEQVYSQVRERVVPDEPTILKVQLPSLGEVDSRRYYVSITSHGGDNEYLSRRQIFFNQNGFGFMLVKTDKPIYKPSQTVNICVVHLDSSLRPHRADSTAQLLIRDAKFRQIFKTKITVEAGEGVACMDIELSEDPNLGRWSINANMQIDLEEGECRIHYSLPSASCNFRVDEFVLPKFEVTLEGPTQITRRDRSIDGTVEAKYTFGENVGGSVRLMATLEARGRRESLKFADITAQLKDGRYRFSIDADDYKHQVRYRYDPFCVKSSVHLVAEVTESGRNDVQEDSIDVPLVANPISVSFDESNPTAFRPGLPYTVKGQASLADGSPARGVIVALEASANNGKDILFNEKIIVDEEGKFSITVKTDKTIKCLKFTLSPVERERSCDSQSVCFSPSPMFSPTDSFLQLTHTSPSPPLSDGMMASIRADATFEFTTLHLVVVGQGSVQLHSATVDSNGASVTSLNASFPVGVASVPRVKVLGVIAREDGELVADLIEIPVRCQLEHRVGVSFGRREASPKDDVTITTRASPDSVVVLGVIDKSLTLLADACKSVDQGNVCKLLRGLTGGFQVPSASCSTDSDSACCPSTCTEPTQRAVGDVFRAVGISLTTNMFQPIAPSPPPPPPPPFFDRFPEFDAPLFEAAPAAPLPTTVPPPGPPAPEDDVEESNVRDFFPETWIWEILRTDKFGIAELKSEVPDTITTWNAEAFAISRDVGLGISPITELTVKKDLFVSLELPYSIIFAESVTITPLVFYFGSEEFIQVRVSVSVDENLELVSNELPSSTIVHVKKGTGTPFNIKIRPLGIGRLPITICARALFGRGKAYDSRQPCIDAVQKNLFVKPGCERFQITKNIYASGTGRQCFDYVPASCAIPGSSKASISVTGDLLSPPDLDRLLVLPYGCGEQNMVRFSLNVVVGLYLMHTDQLPDHLAVKIRNNLQTGYQRQLTYLQGAGCFAIWRNGPCSLWLTAFTARFLLEASEPELATGLGLAAGSELVDVAVIRSAITYLIRQQEPSGKFPVIGRLHNYYLLSRDDFIGLTAYVVITLRAALDRETRSDLQTYVQRAERYIGSQYQNGTQFCNYGLALSTTALSVQHTPSTFPTLRSMVSDLKSRIQDSRNYQGACFLCNECPNDNNDEEDPNTNECDSRPRGEGSSACVETTAYALRALLQVEDTAYTVCLAQWLTRVKSASGGFYSSQDTLVAIDALGRFAEKTFTSDLNKTVLIRAADNVAVTHTITPENRYERRTVEVTTIPSTNNCVLYTGTGTAIIQSTLEYYGCSCCDDSQTFDLILATRKSRESLALTVYVGYRGSGESNMAIVDVEISSGYVFAELKDPENVIERHEIRGSSVIVYINGIKGAVEFSMRFTEEFPVENHQQTPVTVYDYYEPDQIVTKYYLPVTNGTIPTVDIPPPPPPPPPSPPSPPTRPPTRPTTRPTIATESTEPTTAPSTPRPTATEPPSDTDEEE